MALAMLAGQPALAASALKTDYPNDGRTLSVGSNTQQTSGKHDTKLAYSTKDNNAGDWSVLLAPGDPGFERTPGDVAAPKDGVKVDFKNVLSKAFPDWTFNYTKDGKDLSLSDGSLIAHTYSAKLKPNVFNEKASLLGADLDIEYKPDADKGDPTGDGVHWIQVLVDNHRIGGLHDNTREAPENIVDNKGRGDDPYYDNSFFSSSSFFYDTPTREIYQSHYWFAEVFLVDEIENDNGKGGRTVNVYDGVLWGFTNATVPEPGGVWLVAAAAGLGLGRQRSAKAVRS